jgi:hypothetical protein
LDHLAAEAVLLIFIVLPVWMLSGFADWACHRATRIESTSGLAESLIHVAMLGQIGLGVLAAIFLEINAFTLVLLLVMFLLHEVTRALDLMWANGRRHISVLEQWVHDYLGVLPLLALLLIAALHWDKVLMLVQGGASDWGVRLKDPPLPAVLTVSILAGVAAPRSGVALASFRLHQRCNLGLALADTVGNGSGAIFRGRLVFTAISPLCAHQTGLRGAGALMRGCHRLGARGEAGDETVQAAGQCPAFRCAADPELMSLCHVTSLPLA